MSQIQQTPPRVFRLISSVGDCGANDPKEVQKIQLKLIDAGYVVATGRSINPNGRCDVDTLEAIRWSQRLLHLTPTGLINPTDIWFMQALEEVTTPNWRPKNVSGSLHVSIGQITFDAEGTDYITAVAPFRQRKYPFFFQNSSLATRWRFRCYSG